MVFFSSQKKIDFFSPVSIFCAWSFGYLVLSPFLAILFFNEYFNILTLTLVTISLFQTLVVYLITPPFFDGFFKNIVIIKSKHIIDFRFRLAFFSGIILFLILLIDFGASFDANLLEIGMSFRRFLSTEGNGIKYFILVKLLYFMPIIYFAYKIYYGFRLTTVDYMYFPIALILSLVLGSKGIFLSVLLAPFLLYNYFIKCIKIMHLFIFSLCASLLLLLYMYMTNLLDTFESFDFLFALSIIKSRLDVLDNLNYFIEEFSNGNLQPDYFYSFFSAPMQFIPRNIYPEKPQLFSSEITRIIMPDVFYENVTFDFSAIAEGVYNFGLLGFLIPGMIIGIVLKQINYYYEHGNKFFIFSFVYLSFSGFPISLFSSGFIAASSVIFLPINLLLLIGIYILCFKMPKLKIV